MREPVVIDGETGEPVAKSMPTVSPPRTIGEKSILVGVSLLAGYLLGKLEQLEEGDDTEE